MRSSIKNKKKIIIIGSILIFINVLLIISIFLPKISIELNDKVFVTVRVGENYSPLGAKAYVKNIFGKDEIKVTVSGEVDVTKVGKYPIVYTAKANGLKNTKIQIINVIDDVKPQITLNGNVKACKNNKVIDINATANDNYDGNITDKIKFKIEKDEIFLNVSDSSKNESTIKSAIDYVDNEKPVISINGQEVMYIKEGSAYEEEGATASDSCDGDISENIKISGKVDTSKLGEYKIKYEVKDEYGNVVTKERKVVVVDKDDDPLAYVTDGTIYLTFDDGPGQYTAKILDILAKNNIKATFFVTGQFSKYYDLITREYNEGHTVGIHTYSHKWDIYDSVDTYLADFNKIEQIVFDKTGTHPKYFRFPGGTSNTVSRKHSEGIMTTLASLMTEKGYTYFDWSVDCCDTCKNNSVDDIINTIKKYVKGNGNYIILMHDIKKNTLTALPTIIENLKNKGYVFKKIDETTPRKQFAPLN